MEACGSGMKEKYTTLMDKDMLFINSNVPHSTQSLTENRVLVLYFPESFFANEQVLIQLNTLEEQLDEQVLSNLRTLLMEIYNLHYSTGTYDYILAQSRIIQLKYWLVRHFGQTTELSPATSRTDRQKIQTILDFIKEHYTENISLAETARICGYSEAFLSRMFHEVYRADIYGVQADPLSREAIDLLDTRTNRLRRFPMKPASLT